MLLEKDVKYWYPDKIFELDKRVDNSKVDINIGNSTPLLFSSVKTNWRNDFLCIKLSIYIIICFHTYVGWLDEKIGK